MSEDALSLVGDRYQLLQQLGTGGMGVVYRAADRLSGQQVALKYVTAEDNQLKFGSTSNHTDFQLSLAQEFRALAGLRHPHIVSVLDYGFADFGLQQRQPYFTMQLIDGAQPITEYAKGLETAEKVRLLVELLQALIYLHRHGILHRDLKPGNVLITSEGSVKVMDFGLALYQSRTSTDIHKGIVGTMAYMAPELFLDEPASAQSDLFAVGVIAYELFTGRYPFEGKSAGTLLYNIMNSAPDLTVLDVDLAGVLEKLLSKSASERYDSAEAAMDALCDATDQRQPEESRALRDSALQSAKFVGREGELALLVEALDQTVSLSRGSAWLIGGESGVGKTRLLEELRIRALVRGALVVRGQAVEGAGLPYQLWRDPLRRLILNIELSDLEAAILKEIIPDIETLLYREVADAPPVDGRAMQQRLVLTIIDVFRRQEQPVVLLLEDLQWVSESLDSLKLLNLFAAEYPWLIIATYRHDERPTLPNELPRMQVISLPRLSDAAIRELSEAILGDVGRQPELVNLLVRETEGNTFFIVEVMRALAEDAGRLSSIMPATLPRHVMTGGVRQIARRRLNRVPAWALPLLKLVAVAGREIDLNLLRIIGESDLERWLSVCVGASVLEVSDGVWRFTHDKLRETLIRDLNREERPLLHRAVAEALEAVYPDESSYAERLAEHWLAAGDFGKALEYTHRAVGQLINITANYDRAKHLISQGIALANVALSHWRPRLLLQLGDTALKRGEYVEASVHYEAVLYDPDRTSEVDIQLLNNLSRVNFQQGSYAEAKNYAQLALNASHERDDLSGIATSLNSLANVEVMQSAYERARQHYEESLRIRRELRDLWGIAISLNNLGVLVASLGEHETAREYQRESIDLLRQVGDRWATAVSLSSLAFTLLTLNDLDGAERTLREGLQIARNLNAPPVTLSLLAAEARLRFLREDALKSAELAGFLESHPSITGDTREMWVVPLIHDLRTKLDREALDEAIERGRWLDLDDVIDDWGAQQRP
jgi:eukaryotic-like serine/threonine-protein kinase